MSKQPELAAVEIGGHTRSAFLVRATLATGATLGAGSVTPLVRKALAQSESGDVDVLNYALTLEYLEAAFYERALEQVSGLDGDVRDLAERLGADESAHVEALRSTINDLGGQPVEQPTVDFADAFSSRATFLKTANTLEDTGVSAYNGAATMIESKEVLAAAGTIVQVEARHAALIRLERNEPPSPRAFDKASEMQAVLDAVQPFIKS
jgi:rubrerythrin